jgi:hypothetical protein
MRISKLYLVVCAAALGAGIVTVRAYDNPAQAAARAALEEKMRELGASSAPTNAQTSPPAMSQPPAQPAVSTPPSAQNPPPAVSAAPEQTAPMTAAPSGAAMRGPTNPPPATTTMPAVAPAQTPAPMTSSSGHGLFGPVPPPSGSGPGETASQNMQPSMNVQMPPPVAPQKSAFTGSPQNGSVSDAGTALGLKPIQAPALPISSRQQAELQALLEKYDANAITPEQYQTERAKILAEH